MLDCFFYGIATTREERQIAERQWDHIRSVATRIRNSSDREQEMVFQQKMSYRRILLEEARRTHERLLRKQRQQQCHQESAIGSVGSDQTVSLYSFQDAP